MKGQGTYADKGSREKEVGDDGDVVHGRGVTLGFPGDIGYELVKILDRDCQRTCLASYRGHGMLGYTSAIWILISSL